MFLIDRIMAGAAAEVAAALHPSVVHLEAIHHPSADLRGIHRLADLHGSHPADRLRVNPAAAPFWRAPYFGRHGR